MNAIGILSPKTMSGLIVALKKMTPKSRILAGGTDLIIQIRRGEISPDLLVDISGLNEIASIERDGNHIAIGAIATFADILQSSLLHEHARCLVEAARMIGSVQIRNRATIAGNIGTASPAGDAIPPLYVLKASVSILDSRGTVREVPIADLFSGPYRTTLNYNEVITAFRFPILPGIIVSTFVKIGSRSTVTIARLNMAIKLGISGDPVKVTSARVALGAAGKTVFRSPAIEQAMMNAELTSHQERQIVRLLVAEIDSAIPGRYSLPYKRKAVGGLGRQALENLITAATDRSF